MERASRELQERAMAIRLVPIRHAFARFPRLVRDLGSACQKDVELKTSGEDTELDKTLIEAIADPLTHLVRNSIDHGLECRQDRLEAGKPETGQVRLRALQEGGNIVIEVADDGRGLDREKILAKARDRGLISGNDQDLTDEQVFACIFEPGFSTAAKVTDVSGRGVGMDIVRQSLRAVNGSIGLTSAAGKGTTFRMRLPLTMAILEGLSLAVGDEVYVLPLTSIVESIQPTEQDVHMLPGEREVVRVRGEVLPLVRLYEQFGAVPRITEPSKGLLVIVENDGRRVALLVDELIGQSQVVIKSIETNHQKVDGIAGATILGDGRVALILDVPQLLRVHEGSRVVAA
jgi:two-component system chemotaxis sensor kinase CheA